MHFVFRTILKVARVWADGERVDLRGGALKLKCWRRFCKMPKCNQGHSFGMQHSMQGRFLRLNINNWTMGRFLLRNTAIWCQKAAQGALLSQFGWNQGGLHTTREDAKASAKSSTVFYSSRWVQVFMQHSFPILLMLMLYGTIQDAGRQRWSLRNRLSWNFERFEKQMGVEK